MLKKKKGKKKVWMLRSSASVVSKRAVPNPVRALLIIDNEPILKTLREEYKRVLKQTAKAEKDYQTFQKQDLTAWKEWIHAQFGPILTEIRECHEQFERIREIFNGVDSLAFAYEVTHTQAYQIYRAQMEGKWEEVSKYFKLPEDMKEAGGFEETMETGEPSFDENLTDEELMRAFTEQIASLYEKETGRKPPDYEEVMEALTPKKPKAAPDRSVKDVYRTIVLRLHPDRNKDFTPYQQGLWNEAQVAYQNQDLATLELILARIDSSNDDLASINRGSLLRSLIEKVQRDLRMLQTHLNQAKQSPAWKFSQTKNLQHLHARAKRELETELRGVQRSYLEIQRDFYELEKESNTWWEKITRPRPARSKPKKAKKAQPADMWTGELPF